MKLQCVPPLNELHCAVIWRSGKSPTFSELPGSGSQPTQQRGEDGERPPGGSIIHFRRGFKMLDFTVFGEDLLRLPSSAITCTTCTLATLAAEEVWVPSHLPRIHCRSRTNKDPQWEEVHARVWWGSTATHCRPEVAQLSPLSPPPPPPPSCSSSSSPRSPSLSQYKASLSSARSLGAALEATDWGNLTPLKENKKKKPPSTLTAWAAYSTTCF